MIFIISFYTLGFFSLLAGMKMSKFDFELAMMQQMFLLLPCTEFSFMLLILCSLFWSFLFILMFIVLFIIMFLSCLRRLTSGDNFQLFPKN